MASAYTGHIERNSSFDCGVAHGSYQQKLGTNLCITTGRNAQPVDAIAIFTATPKLGRSRAGLVSLDPPARSMRTPSTRPRRRRVAPQLGPLLARVPPPAHRSPRHPDPAALLPQACC